MGTTNRFLEKLVHRLKIPYFRGTFMSDELPSKARKRECGILNLDDSEGDGTHWTCWFVLGENKCYFDSYGAAPPSELQRYLGPGILHTDYKIQSFGSDICGELCVLVLYLLSKGYNFQDIILDIVYKDHK